MTDNQKKAILLLQIKALGFRVEIWENNDVDIHEKGIFIFSDKKVGSYDFEKNLYKAYGLPVSNEYICKYISECYEKEVKIKFMDDHPRKSSSYF